MIENNKIKHKHYNSLVRTLTYVQLYSEIGKIQCSQFHRNINYKITVKTILIDYSEIVKHT